MRPEIKVLFSLLAASNLVLGEGEFGDTKFEQLKQQPLQRLWGIPDTTALVGYLFHYQIPQSAFDGSISKFTVSGQGGDELPSWLTFHEKSGVFEGVPSVEDVGDHYVTVNVFDNDMQSSKDVFSIEVISKPKTHFSHLKSECKQSGEKTILSIVLDSDSSLLAKQKVFIIKNFAEFLNLKKDMIFMGHTIDKNGLLSPNVVDAGPGNIIQRKTTGPASVLSLQVGCKGELWSKLTDRIEMVKDNSKNGELASILNCPVIGWKITREKSDFRERRDTPGINLMDSNEEVSGAVPEPRVVVENTETPAFRIDPSPTYIQEVSITHKRRHHRGELNSETLTLPSLSIMPTPTFIPDRPTLPNSISFDPIDPYDVSTEISPTAVYNPVFSPSSFVENATDDSERSEDNFVSSPSSSTSLSQGETPSSSHSAEPTPTLPNNHTTSEEIAYGTRNFPPNIGQRIKKLPVTSGKALRYKIPDDAFSDLEDGSAKDMVIKLLSTDKAVLPDNSWIQFDSKTQSIYALPLEEHISRWNFTLRATDSGGLSAEDQIEILVQNHKARRTFNHEFAAVLVSTPPGLTLDWQLHLLEAISKTFGDPDISQITVLSISLDPPTLKWANDSIPRSGCPTSDLDNMLKVLNSDGGLMKFAEPLHVKNISWSGRGHCETKISGDPAKGINYPPAPRNQVDYFNATVGQLLIFQVPEDTFYDPEDGSTRHLKLYLANVDRGRIAQNHWLQFDTKNQEFFGIPSIAGESEYQLICEDSSGLTASDGLIVKVHSAPKVMYNVEFSITLTTNYNDFAENPKMKRLFVERLAQVFKDSNTNSIVINGFAPGSTVISWHNKSLPTAFCPDSEILALRQMILGDDEKVTESVSKLMAPEFPVVSIKLTPTGICLGALTEISVGNNDHPPNYGVVVVTPSEHYIIGLVVPALVIAVMLLCAGLVACVLYRRKRTGKMSVGDEDERQTFRSKGIPVIFQDELDERPEPTNKSPVIMKEEKPPLPPPEYHRGPPLATTALLSDTEDSPYQPPPPFTTSRDSSRPKPTPTYRMPPPYVPP